MNKIIMSRKEMEQVTAFEKLLRKEITQKVAGQILGLTQRQVSTKFGRYKKCGPEGLIHKNRGKPSKKRWSKEQEEFSINLLKTDWMGFGPTFAAQKLLQYHDIKVSAETLRKAMIIEGVWKVNCIKTKHRKRRPRKECVGIMIQLDGSPHDWFEGRAPKCTLLVFIDDATSRVLWMELVKSESVNSIMTAVRNYIEAFGRPVSFYVDCGSVFRVNTNNHDCDKLTQFERAMQELNIKVIHAHSPQAKGRVERSNKTHQDRLPKELRLAGISTMEAANKFIIDYYLPEHNKRFSVDPGQASDAHRNIDKFDLNNIFCIKEKRIIQNDFVISYKKRLFQLAPKQRTIIRPKETVVVREHLNGAISLTIRAIELDFTEIMHRPVKPVIEKVYKNEKPRPVHPNSRLWNGPQNSRPINETTFRRSC